MLLRHVQSDPLYRPFVAEVLDSVRPLVEGFDPGMYYRAAWIFVSSPHTVTPFHIDRNHGLLLQISGSKKVYAWEPDDRAVSDQAREHFHYRRSLALVTWNEEFRDRARVFQVRPGTGVYLPLNSPHMVETSEDRRSRSASATTRSPAAGTRSCTRPMACCAASDWRRRRSEPDRCGTR